MPVFEYKGLDSRGKSVAGILDADSPRALRSLLRKDGIFLTDLAEAAGKKERRGIEIEHLFERVTQDDVAIFTRQLATLLKSGITLVEALSATIDQSEKEKMKKILSETRRAVNEGSSLADALRPYAKVFPPLFVNMVAAGEASGALDVVLLRLADFGEGQVKLRNKLIGALVYPVLMLIVAGIIVSILFTVVIPKVMKIFEQTKQALPLVTQVLIGVSTFAKSYWWAIASLGAGGVFLFLRFIDRPAGRQWWDRTLLGLPVIGPMVRMIAVARFSRTLSTLLGSGVPLLGAIDIVKNIVNNEIIAGALEEARESIREGESIAAPLKRSGEFPPIVIHMIAIGEKSGQLEEMLVNVADSYDNQVETKVSMLMSLMEPVMIVLMGGVVAFIVFSILLPILQMNELIQK